MKLKLLFTFLVLFSILGYNQDNYDRIEIKGSRNDQTKHLNTFFSSSYFSFYMIGKVKPKILVSKINENNELIDSKELNLAKVFYPVEVKKIEGGAAILYIERAQGKYYLRLTKFNFESFSTEGEEVLVKEMKSNEFGNDIFNSTPINRLKLKVDFNTSKNGKFITVCSYSAAGMFGNKNKKLNYQLYDSDIKRLFGDKVLFNNIVKEKGIKSLYDFQVTNDGKIQGIIFNQNKKKLRFLTLKRNNIITSDAIEGFNYLFIYNDNLRHKMVERTDGKFSWSVLAKVNKKYLLVMYTLEDSFKSINQNVIDVSNFIPSKNNYFLTNLISKENGELIVNIEKDESVINNQAQDHTSIKGDIIVLKLDALNELDWHTVIPKRQSSRMAGEGNSNMTGFACFLKDNGNIQYFFNSNEKNHPGLLTKKSSLSGALIKVEINNNDGKLIDERIIFNEEERISPIDFKYFNNGKFVLCEHMRYLGKHKNHIYIINP